jgi:hypothetical protein
MTPHISSFSHHRKGPLSGNVATTGYDRDKRISAILGVFGLVPHDTVSHFASAFVLTQVAQVYGAWR